MGCCGSSSKPISVSRKRENIIAEHTEIQKDVIQQIAERDLSVDTIWIQYNGQSLREFGVRGRMTGIMYMIHGPNHIREIFAIDSHPILRLGKGADFTVIR